MFQGNSIETCILPRVVAFFYIYFFLTKMTKIVFYVFRKECWILSNSFLLRKLLLYFSFFSLLISQITLVDFEC